MAYGEDLGSPAWRRAAIDCAGCGERVGVNALYPTKRGPLCSKCDPLPGGRDDIAASNKRQSDRLQAWDERGTQ